MTEPQNLRQPDDPAAREAILTKGTEPAPAVVIGKQDAPLEGVIAATSGDTLLVAVTPTQVRRPWRATARTLFQALVALAILFPILVETSGLDPASAPWLAVPLAVAAALARIMALPQVNDFLARFLPFLSAAGR